MNTNVDKKKKEFIVSDGSMINVGYFFYSIILLHFILEGNEDILLRSWEEVLGRIFVLAVVVVFLSGAIYFIIYVSITKAIRPMIRSIFPYKDGEDNRSKYYYPHGTHKKDDDNLLDISTKAITDSVVNRSFETIAMRITALTITVIFLLLYTAHQFERTTIDYDETDPDSQLIIQGREYGYNKS